jgi:two-component system sensor histidine kinase/response regulator
LQAAATKGEPYHLALLDVQMPELDGFMLAAAIKADPSLTATRLIVLTSSGQALSSAELKARGIEAYLVKPVKQSRLFDCMISAASGPTAADNALADPSHLGAASASSPKTEAPF